VRVKSWVVIIRGKSRWWARHQVELQRRTKQPWAWRSRWRAEAETAQGTIRKTISQQKKCEHMCVGRWDIVCWVYARSVTMSRSRWTNEFWNSCFKGCPSYKAWQGVATPAILLITDIDLPLEKGGMILFYHWYCFTTAKGADWYCFTTATGHPYCFTTAKCDIVLPLKRWLFVLPLEKVILFYQLKCPSDSPALRRSQDRFLRPKIERFFWRAFSGRGITAREQLSRAVILARFEVIQ